MPCAVDSVGGEYVALGGENRPVACTPHGRYGEKTYDRWWWNDDDSIYPRIIARIIDLDQRGLATIQADDGTKYEVVAGTEWHVGDTVQCERSDRERVPLWKQFDCRKY